MCKHSQFSSKIGKVQPPIYNEGGPHYEGLISHPIWLDSEESSKKTNKYIGHFAFLSNPGCLTSCKK